MRRIVPFFWLIVFLSVPLWLHDPYFLHVLIVTGIFIITAMSLNLLLGYTGQLSLGHVAFFGIGAYASSLVAVGFDVELFGLMRLVHRPWPPIAGLIIATAIAGLFGYLISKLSFKVRGAYFILVSLSFAEVARLVALNWVELTQGPMAINNIPPFSVGLPGLGYVALWSKAYYYYLVLFIAVVAYLLIARIVGSSIGRAMIAFKQNEPLALSVGIDVTRYLVLATVVSAGLAGAAGSLYAHYIKVIDPDIFAFMYTVTMIIMVIVGGKGTLSGPIVGWTDLRLRAGGGPIVCRRGGAVDHLRIVIDRDNLCCAARDCSGHLGMDREPDTPFTDCPRASTGRILRPSAKAPCRQRQTIASRCSPSSMCWSTSAACAPLPTSASAFTQEKLLGSSARMEPARRPRSI